MQYVSALAPPHIHQRGYLETTFGQVEEGRHVEQLGPQETRQFRPLRRFHLMNLKLAGYGMHYQAASQTGAADLPLTQRGESTARLT